MRRVTIKGEVDLATAPDLMRVLDEAMDAEPGGSVEVDFSGVSFIDSTGLGVLVSCRKRARTLGGELVLVGVQERVLPVFAVTGLDKVFFTPV